MRITVADLFRGVAALTILLATWQRGLAVFFSLGIPLSILIAIPRPWRHRKTNMPIAAALIVAGLALLIWDAGWPIEFSTWLALLGPFVWLRLAACHEQRGAQRQTVMPAFGILLLLLNVGRMELSTEIRYDLRTGAITWARCGLVFREEGNRHLVEGYLGLQRDPIMDARNGRRRLYLYDRVDSRSMLFARELQSALEILPSDSCRRQVLRCLATPENFARIHQSMKLATLYYVSQFESVDVDGWWRINEPLFRIETDAERAALLVWGWLDECDEVDARLREQRQDFWSLGRFVRAAQNQEMGLGADADFYEEFFVLRLRKENPGRKIDRSMIQW